jgi:hypothetical protein
MKAFDWVEFPEGRARFSGAIGYIFSWDELPHETFCVEVDGCELFGEIKKIYTENQSDYNLEILYFGYRNRSIVGAPEDAARIPLTELQAQRVASLTQQLIAVISKANVYPVHPPVLSQTEKSKFLGSVTFKDGWVRIKKSDNQSVVPQEILK